MNDLIIYARSALQNAHHSIGYAFCKALGIVHLIGSDGISDLSVLDESVLECFYNRIDPRDIRYRKEV